MTIQEFIAYIAPIIVKDSNQRNFLPSPRIAQSVLESGHGTSLLATKAFNLFGLKDNNQWDGKTFSKVTGEYYSSGYTEVTANFQAYDSWEESVYWQGWYLQNRKFSPSSKTYVYGNLQGVRDYKEFCRLLKADGYATGPEYDVHLIEIIEKYNLTQYDVQTLPVAPDNDTPIGRLALTVGHSRLANGSYTSADGRKFGGVLEYDYNKSLAPIIKTWVEKAGWVCDVIVCPEKKFNKPIEEKGYKLGIVNDKSKDYDLVCELHLNASGNHKGTGTEVLYLSSNGKKYAQKVVDQLATMINKHGSGLVCRNNLYMLTATKPTAIMIEGFFCDNPSDCAKMANQSKVAKCIAQGIVGHEITAENTVVITPQPVPKDPDPEPSNNGFKYWIQCGAYSVKQNAVNQVNALKVAGISSFIKTVNNLNVVQAGAFKTRESAEKQMRLIESKGFKTILREYN